MDILYVFLAGDHTEKQESKISLVFCLHGYYDKKEEQKTKQAKRDKRHYLAN